MISESVENKANEVLLNILTSVEQASGFVVEQAPDVVQQLLTWHLVQSLIFFELGMCILLIAVPVIIAGCKEDDGDTTFAFCFVAAIITAAGLGIGLTHLEWLKILVAPKLYVLEYAASLVGNSRY